ncbi:hypothetical protein GP486_000330 [Trichoglossum hirsutum]|uniref:DUF676 domain-containing protein n=1 Tax=Trichoglossum hirsutum TaxID=265104 RepID=A0A9P8RTP0_9PEZI|nr:hypothetical protein GP486_000330 [Trichoglossum hirsutum]
MDANSTLLGLAVYASLRTKQANVPTFNDIGLQAIHEPKGQHFDIDIIFVHGLQGHLFNTWKGLNCSWPGEFLAEDVPTARLLTFGYQDLIGEGIPVSIKALGQLLLGAIALKRRQDESSSRPIIFVAHSLGGLIVKSVR